MIEGLRPNMAMHNHTLTFSSITLAERLRAARASATVQYLIALSNISEHHLTQNQAKSGHIPQDDTRTLQDLTSEMNKRRGDCATEAQWLRD
jgi:hypothetical protein